MARARQTTSAATSTMKTSGTTRRATGHHRVVQDFRERMI
jgi:hypothetical protein